jgi:hypothetical protein
VVFTSLTSRFAHALLALGLATLAGCGVSKDAPPTDDEIFSVYLAYWNASPGGLDLVTPISARKLGDGITQDSPFGKGYSVTVSISFRVDADITYQCSSTWASGIVLGPSGSSNFPNSARAGDTIACPVGQAFSKVEEGWMEFFGLPGLGPKYLIKR